MLFIVSFKNVNESECNMHQTLPEIILHTLIILKNSSIKTMTNFCKPEKS
jgi:hypothetical protein